ncbi:transketolase [Spirochaetota bacterium]
MKEWKENIKIAAKGIRTRVLEHTINNNGGYMSQACSSSEILASLYLKIMNLPHMEKPLEPEPFPGVPAKDNNKYFTGAKFNGPHGPDYDRFFLSPSHYALPVYAALIEVGRMSTKGLEKFNRDGSSVEMIGAEHSPGMEVTAGSLGQGLSQAAGISLARKLKGEKGMNWIFMSDGEFQIGMTWEALQVMSNFKLDNMGIYVDVNGQQCDGLITEVMNIEPLDKRIESFGARVFSVDGHDIEALTKPSELPPDGRPLVVLAQTDPCRGLEPLRANAPKLHYLRFKSPDEKELYAQALKDMKGKE